MKTITFDRYASKLQRVCIDEIAEVQKTIEATFTDLEINPYITQNEIAEEIDRINKTYENFIGFISERIFAEIMEILTDDEQDFDDVVWSLVTAYLLLDEVKFSICTPVLDVNETALENLSRLANEGFESLKQIDCVVLDPDEDESTDTDEAYDDEADK